MGVTPITVIGAQEICGASVSLTFTVNEQLGPAVVEQFTVVVPTGKDEPDAGAQVTVPQEPVVVGENVTVAAHWPGALFTVILAGQLIVQLCVTVTVKLQLAVLPDASVAVQVTVVVPTGKLVPDDGEHSTVAPGQLSFGIGSV